MREITSGATVSNHAYARAKKRCGLNKKALDNLYKKALVNGIRSSTCRGSLCRYLDNIFLSHRNGTGVIYGHVIFIVCNHHLITVMHLPKKYYNYVDKLSKDL